MKTRFIADGPERLRRALREAEARPAERKPGEPEQADPPIVRRLLQRLRVRRKSREDVRAEMLFLGR